MKKVSGCELAFSRQPKLLCEAPVSSPPRIQASHSLSQGACLIIFSIWDHNSLRASSFKLPVQPDIFGRWCIPFGWCKPPTPLPAKRLWEDRSSWELFVCSYREGKAISVLFGSFCYASQKSNSHPKERRPLYLTGGVGHFCREAGAAGSVGKKVASSKWKNPRQLLRTLAQPPKPTLCHLEKRYFKTAGKKQNKQKKREREKKRNNRCYPSGIAYGTLCPADSPARMTPET